MPTSTPNGVEIHYEQHGTTGDALVLVHGFTGDLTDWRYQVEAFAPTHRVLVLDNRGHGRSGKPEDAGEISVLKMADDAESIAAEVGFERFHLVGHSMGGAIAQEIALRSPAKLLSMTLEDTSHHFASHPMKVPENPPPLPKDREQYVLERMTRMGPEMLRAGWKALMSWPGTTERLAALRLPAMIVYGRGDAEAILAGSRRLAELIEGAQLHEIAGAAHCPQEETPDEYNALLRAFVEENHG